MQLEEYLIKKKWTGALFARLCGVPEQIIWKYLAKGTSLSLDSALLIEVATEGEVTAWDISRNADSIRNKTFRPIKEDGHLILKKRKEKAEKKNQENKKEQNDMKPEIPVMTQSMA